MPRLAEGEIVAGYRVAMFIAGGGMGEVYRATEVESGRPVALKLLAASGDHFAERFGRERAIAATLDHPRIVPVYDTGVDDTGRAYIAMRLVEGRDLTSLLRDGPLPLKRSLAILAQVAEALDVAHDRGLVHRDVKPGNILLEARSDGGDDVFLSDFGLVKELVVDDGLSTTGAVLGTPDYMAPELVHAGTSDARGDVYALGCVLFEMLAGRPPFARGSEVATIWAHVNDDPPSLTELVPGLPAGFDGVIGRALAKEPEERYASAGALASAARAAGTGEVVTAPLRSVASTDSCPYKGLAAFAEGDAAFFFGRESLVAELTPRLRQAGFLAVVGASGSGKSSLVCAGLVPALDEPASVITPGERPFDALAGATTGSVLVVDQFEELFTLCPDAAARGAFVHRILQHDRAVIIVLRADFYGRCAQWPDLGAALERSQALVGPMSDVELRSAIEKPAQRVGLHLEHRLLETVVREATGQPAALPLVSHALLETWNRRIGRTLTLGGYREAGGVEGAIASTAETVYSSQDARSRALLRSIFLRLAALGEGTEDTRRRTRVSELLLQPEDEPDVTRLLDELAAARLVTLDEGTAEVAHEALIRHWPTLQGWLNEDREGRRVHRRVTEAAQEWDELGRDPGALWRGGRLATASEWADGRDDELNALEREFLDTSRAAEETELAAIRRRNRRLRLLVAALAVLLAVAAVAAVVAVRQTGEAQDQQQAADRQAVAAQEQSRIALSRGLAGQAQALLTRRLDQALLVALESDRVAQTDESRDALMATVQRTSGIEAILSGDAGSGRRLSVSRDGSVTAVLDAAGRVALWDQTGRPIGAVTLPAGAGEAPPLLAVRGDGRYIAAVTGSGLVWLTDLSDPANPIGLNSGAFDPDGLSPPKAVAFSNDGERLVGVFEAGVRLSTSDDIAVFTWEVAPGRVSNGHGVARGSGAVIQGAGSEVLALSADGTLVVVGDGDRLVLASTISGTVLRRLPARLARVDGRALIAVAPDGTRLAFVEPGGRVRIWSVSGSPTLQPAPRAPVSNLGFTGDGRELLIGTTAGDVEVFAAATGRPSRRPAAGHASGVIDMAQPANDGVPVSLGADGLVIRHAADDVGLERVILHEPKLGAVVLSADGDRLALARTDGIVRILEPADGGRRATIRTSAGQLAMSFNETGILTIAGGDLAVRRWNPGSASPTRVGDLDGWPLAVSGDGRYVASGDQHETGDVFVRRVGDQQVPPFLESLPNRPIAAAFRPDSAQLAVSFLDGGIELLDPDHPGDDTAHLPGVAGVAINDIAYRADGALLASVGADGTLRFWNPAAAVTDGEPLSAGDGTLYGVAFLAGGDVVATLGADTLRLWDVRRRVAIGPGVPFPRGDGAFAVEAPPDGHEILVAWRDAVVRVDDLLWTNDRARLAERVCELVTRSLTREELAQFEPGVPYHEQCDGSQPVAR